MKTSATTLAVVLALAAATAQAQAIRITVPDDVPVPSSTLTRAEVLADFHLWRLSGLQDLHRGELTPDTESAAYRRAEATYAWLRASSQREMLVSELARRPQASVQLAREGGKASGPTATAASRAPR